MNNVEKFKEEYILSRLAFNGSDDDFVNVCICYHRQWSEPMDGFKVYFKVEGDFVKVALVPFLMNTSDNKYIFQEFLKQYYYEFTNLQDNEHLY